MKQKIGEIVEKALEEVNEDADERVDYAKETKLFGKDIAVIIAVDRLCKVYLNAVQTVILVFLRGDHALLVHAAQRVILLLLAAGEVIVRRHLGGVTYHSRENGSLADVDVGNVLAEVVL